MRFDRDKAEKFFVIAVSIWLLYHVLFSLASLVFSDSHFEKETNRYHQRLLDAKRIGDVNLRVEVLHELATEIGAGSVRRTTGEPVRLNEHVTVTTSHDAMSESELVSNINLAIQTRSSLSAQKLAERSNGIAFVALVVSVMTAIGSCLAWRSKLRVKKNELTAH